MNILVAGGAGYIGAHMVKMLAYEGHNVVVLDNLTTGHRESVRYGELIVGDLGDAILLDKLFKTYSFDSVIHFAGSSLVGESIIVPSKYYRNNISNTLNLLDSMVDHKVQHFVFSSTAATFGEPSYTPIDGAHPQEPINPYGASKLMVERVLKDYANAYGVNSVSLRYFNACGADPEGELGECHDPETHLIPLVLQAASGRRSSITVFGRDYPTEDGTCVRDYIHVHDLCSAHVKALDMLNSGQKSGALAYNLGNGIGFSVKQVIDAARVITQKDGRDVIVQEGRRRKGDPAVLVADASLARSELGWVPKYSDLSTIIEHAWRWEKKLVGI